MPTRSAFVERRHDDTDERLAIRGNGSQAVVVRQGHETAEAKLRAAQRVFERPKRYKINSSR
jgi:hypothetical protein